MKFYSVDKKLNRFSDYIRGEMKRRRISQDNLAYQLGLERSCLTRRLAGKTEWTMREVIMLSEILEFSLGDWE